MNINELPNDLIIQLKKGDLIEAFKTVISEVRPSPLKQWLTVKELCSYTGYKAPTIYKYIQLGKIPHYKRQGKIMFLQNDIDHWLNSGKRGTMLH